MTSVTPEESANPTEPMSRAETARRFCSPGARPDAVSVLQRPSRPLTDDGKLATAVRETGNMFAPRSRRSARHPLKGVPVAEFFDQCWFKISDVTVLEGATPASAGSESGSSGSTVPGQ